MIYEEDTDRKQHNYLTDKKTVKKEGEKKRKAGANRWKLHKNIIKLFLDNKMSERI